VIEGELQIRNRLGLHARAAARFVSAAGRFRSQVTLQRGERRADGKSILGILLLAAARGSTMHLRVEGPDEEEAFRTLEELVVAGFGEGSA
jgi:phosphocarrier protein